jgi:sulfite exporter TauE/SafE
MHMHVPLPAVGGDLPTLVLALFLMGLAGSFTHCVGMCGPFVIAQVTAGLEASGEKGYGTLQRMRGAALLPYHLGRATTYVALGAASAGVLGFFANHGGLRIAAAAALALAAFAMIAQALGRTLPLVDRLLPRAGVLPAAPGIRSLLARPQGWRGYALGAALGFIPCGMLYAAIAAASAAGSVAGGAVAMSGFALGTVPGLIGVGWAGLLFGRRWRRAAAILGPAAMLVSAAMLLAMALRLVT